MRSLERDFEAVPELATLVANPPEKWACCPCLRGR
jgi:hypothetical protein